MRAIAEVLAQAVTEALRVLREAELTILAGLGERAEKTDARTREAEALKTSAQQDPVPSL